MTMNLLTQPGSGPGAIAAGFPAPRPWQLGVVSGLSGILLALSVPTLPLWPLAFLWLVPMLWAALAAPTCAKSFQQGLWTGFLASSGLFCWLIGGIRALWGLRFASALGIFLLVCAWQALFFGALGVCLRIAHRRTGLPLALIAPITLVALELVFPFIVPWHFAALTAWLLPLIQLAELTGPLGVTFCLAMVSGALYDGLMARSARRPLPLRTLLFVAVTLLLVVGFGLVRMHQVDAQWAAAPKVKIGVVQSNIRADWKPQIDRLGHFDQATAARLREQGLRKHLTATAQLTSQGAQLIVWPETAFPTILPHHSAAGLVEAQTYLQFRVPVLCGATTVDAQHRWFNSALMIDPHGQRVTGHYDKMALFSFAEDIPFRKWFPTLRRHLPASIGGYEPGTAVTSFALPDARAPGGAFRVAPLICQDDIREDLGAAAGRLHPQVLVSIGNDGWFGHTAEPWHHLAHAVYLAVEQRTGMVRAAQTGVSAFVDATGRVRSHLKPTDPPDAVTVPAGTLLADIAMREGGHTFYATVGTLWGRGDLLGLLMLAALGGMLALPRPTRRRLLRISTSSQSRRV